MLNLHFPAFPVLTTERLILRQLNITDANEIMILRSDERVNKFIGRKGEITIDEAQKFIEKINTSIQNKESMYWVITLKRNNTLIGTICYWNIIAENGIAEIGYELYPDFQGKGIMQEAIPKIIEFGFNKMHINNITAFPEAGNKKSIALLEKYNFRLDDTNKFMDENNTGLTVYYLTRSAE